MLWVYSQYKYFALSLRGWTLDVKIYVNPRVELSSLDLQHCTCIIYQLSVNMPDNHNMLVK